MVKTPSFCVVLPMFNEESNAKSVVTNVANYLATVETRTAIITVDDGSTDGTLAALKALQQSIANLIVVVHERNSGYGAANRSAFSRAVTEGFDYALVMDADGTQSPEYIGSFFAPMQQSIDFIKASRYISGSRVVGVPFKRKAVSWAGNLLAKLMFRLPLTDYTNGFRAIKTTLLAQICCREAGFTMLMEEVAQAKALGAKFAEVPYTLTVRTMDESTSKFTYSWNTYRGYLRHLFKR